jgi:hypothetical protein
MVGLLLEGYTEQVKIWPKAGRHVLAQFDAETVIVYQAFAPAIGLAVAERGSIPSEVNCGLNFVIPSFLEMMFRSDWGTKKDHEAILALRIRSAFFDSLLTAAMPVYWDGTWFNSFEEWERRAGDSLVWSLWESEYHPSGLGLERWLLRLTLRGKVSEKFGRRELVEAIDLSKFVAEQRGKWSAAGVSALVTPRERVYPADPAVARRLALALPMAEPTVTPDPAGT